MAVSNMTLVFVQYKSQHVSRKMFALLSLIAICMLAGAIYIQPVTERQGIKRRGNPNASTLIK